MLKSLLVNAMFAVILTSFIQAEEIRVIDRSTQSSISIKNNDTNFNIQEDMIAYDSAPEVYYPNALTPGTMFAVRFTPVQACSLTYVQVVSYNGAGNAIIHVMSDNGTDPGTDLIDPFTVNLSGNISYQTINLPERLLVGAVDFHVVVEYSQTPPPFVTADGDGTTTQRSKLFQPGDTDWSVLSTDLNIRAFVVYFDEEVQKITAYDGSANDFFGERVAIDNDFMVLGAFGDDHFGEDNGSAYVFRRSGDGWSQFDHITDPNWDHGAAFGKSVSISGEVIAVGVPFDIISGSVNGSVCIFYRPDVYFSFDERLTANDAQEGDYFGEAVSIGGDYVLIGARGDDDYGNLSGSAYVFHRSGDAWSQQAKLVADDAAPLDYFGYDVCIDGDYAIVGARFDDDGGNNSGAAYIFRRSGSTWNQQDKLVASDANPEDEFGISVSIDGEYAAVGAWFDDDYGSQSGSAYVFHRSGDAWSQQAKIHASDFGAEDRFGISVDLDGDYLLVGAHFNDDKGAAYLFRRSGSTWEQQDKLTASDGAIDDYFGWSGAIDGNTIVVGADGDDDNGSESGSAYIYSDFALSVDSSPQRLPMATMLYPNFPNPFNAQTVISYDLPKTTCVKINVYDLLGRNITTLINTEQNAGYHKVVWNAENVSSGLYFYILQTEDHKESKKMVLLK